jgi:predicted  nucleic acid-binding Zn-ribbon protein
LSGKNLAAISQEIERLKARAASSADPDARQQYEQTVKTREEELTVLRDLMGAVERVYANLARIVATLEGLSTKIVRMRAMDTQAMDNLSGDMNAELERMNREIDTFEETLRHLVSSEMVQT